jgi:spore maturation protein CgeB
MQAICAGEFWHGASARAVAQGLRELGWCVQEVDYSQYFLRGEALELRAANRLLSSSSRRSFNAAILDTAELLSGGIFITYKGSYVTADTLAALKSQGIRSLLYYPDVKFQHPDVDLKVIESVDYLLTTKSYHLPYLDEIRGPGRSRFLHHGYSPLVHRPHAAQVPDADCRYDIAYVGNPDESKARLLTAVAAAFPKLRMVVAGNGWQRFAAGSALEGRVTKRAIVGDLMAELIQRSRINIAVNGRPPDSRGWYDRVSTRTFEIPACKGFMLHEDNEEVRALYEPKREIDVFESADELCERIAHYLDRPDERAEMVERAYRRAVPAYSYYERAKVIAAAAEEAGPVQ